MRIRRISIIVFILTLMVFFCGCNKKKPIVETNEAEIEFIQPATNKIGFLETLQLEYSLKNANGKAEYLSSNEEIAKVDSNGLVTGYSEGDVTIYVTVTCDDEGETIFENEYELTVYNNTKYVVTLVNGTDISTVEVMHGEDLMLPVVEKEGYIFLGWRETSTSVLDHYVIQVKNVQKECSFYAKYEKAQFTITLLPDGGLLDETTLTVNNGENITLPTPTKEGYTFMGWEIMGWGIQDSEITILTITELTNVKNDYILKAKWEKNTFTITLNPNGGTLDTTIFNVKKGENITLPQPSKEHHDFLGWKKGYLSALFFETGEIYEDLTFTAEWKVKTYKITYELDGGTYSGKTTIEYGKTLTLSEPTKKDHKFLGWSLEKGSTKYIKKVENIDSDITLYANYEKKTSFNVKFYLNGGSKKYSSYDDVVNDFLKDISNASGVSITGSNFESKARAAAFNKLIKDNTLFNKWKWLFEYIAKNEAHSTGKTTIKNVISTRNVSTNDQWFVTRDFSGFVNKKLANFYYQTAPMDWTNFDLQNGIWKAMNEVVTVNDTKVLLENAGTYPYHEFVGWYDNENCTGNMVTSITKDCSLYAKWDEGKVVESITITNPITELLINTSYKLNWMLNPTDATVKTVKITSSNPSVATISESGKILALAKGSCVITIKSDSSSKKEVTMEFRVIKPGYFDVSYETTSYVAINEVIKLNASYVNSDDTIDTNVEWITSDESIATVDNGMVTGRKAGLVTITAKIDDKSFEFGVTVLPNDLSDEVKFILSNHNSNILTVYDLRVGTASTGYNYDIAGGVSNLIFEDLKIDRTYYDKLEKGKKNYGDMPSLEFITVHYTGNMNDTSDADNNCSYFNNPNYDASIHYVTGRSNLYGSWDEDQYYAFAGLNEKYAAWHATTGKSVCKWLKTGVKVKDTDPSIPVISISQNSKYTFNGIETIISIPKRDDGIVVTGPTFKCNGATYTSINEMGLAWRIVNGEYEMGSTWWGTQRTCKALCTQGGNMQSIGIESCVDKGSDIMHTWHTTAQLVADIMKRHNLDISRVVGHHFFSGKDCPQPLLANNLELWNELIKMVEAEYERITTFKDSSFTMEVVNGDGVLSKKGLITQQPDAKCVSYKVIIKNGGKTEEITLSTCVESFYKCDVNRREPSLQNLGFEIK